MLLWENLVCLCLCCRISCPPRIRMLVFSLVARQSPQGPHTTSPWSNRRRTPRPKHFGKHVFRPKSRSSLGWSSLSTSALAPTSPSKTLSTMSTVHVAWTTSRSPTTSSSHALTLVGFGKGSAPPRPPPSTSCGTAASRIAWITPYGPLFCWRFLRKFGMHRNAKAFRRDDLHSSATLKKIIDDLDLWSHHISKQCDKVSAFSWWLHLSSIYRKIVEEIKCMSLAFY